MAEASVETQSGEPTALIKSIEIDGFKYNEAYPGHANVVPGGNFQVPAEPFIDRRVMDVVDVHVATLNKTSEQHSITLEGTMIRLRAQAAIAVANGDLVPASVEGLTPSQELTEYLKSRLDAQSVESIRALQERLKQQDALIGDMKDLVHTYSPELAPAIDRRLGEWRPIPTVADTLPQIETKRSRRQMKLVTPVGKAAAWMYRTGQHLLGLDPLKEKQAS